jgi:RNA polymerase sigma factor (sigma-70 family)
MPKEKSEQNKWIEENLLPYEAMLRSWLLSRFSRGVEIEDVIQESYIRVLKARDKGEIRAPKAFLFATARNFALNAVRASFVRGETTHYNLDDSEIIDTRPGVTDSIVRNQELEILTKAIQSLPDRCRQIFTLRKVYGMPQREIAKKLKISPRTVNAQISIGVNKCVEFVENYRGE